MATVGELSAPYEDRLLPVLRAQSRVCRVCHSSAGEGWALCSQCGAHRQGLAATAFVVLAVKEEQLARELWVYKAARAERLRRGRLDHLLQLARVPRHREQPEAGQPQQHRRGSGVFLRLGPPSIRDFRHP